MTIQYVHPDDIRSQFSETLSAMYRAEVPQYGTLLDLVADINSDISNKDAELKPLFEHRGEPERLNLEYHGAIRLGTAAELFTIRRIFAVMGMQPVGYYDLSSAGVPVHATAFRPVDDAALRHNPFRVFTSLLRLELIEDNALRAEVGTILAARDIFTPRSRELLALHESQGGLTSEQADEFIEEVLETFRWHQQATVSVQMYRHLHDAHRLIADVVSFRGPHINHLTPRTLDIDAVQTCMPVRGINPKAVIEGPPRRACPILLRQTSFKALEERVAFIGEDGEPVQGHHTARFGEVEQRGAALTPKGRLCYDALLNATRARASVDDAQAYTAALRDCFDAMPDDWAMMREQGLAYFRYGATPLGLAANGAVALPSSIDTLVGDGLLQFAPILYEDFLPVSAAGIFQSNLGGAAAEAYATRSSRDVFALALGCTPLDELMLYAAAQTASLRGALGELGFASPALDAVLATLPEA